jgi:hypothetical protein
MCFAVQASASIAPRTGCAFRFVPEGTLTDADVDAVVANRRQARSRLGVVLRS